MPAHPQERELSSAALFLRSIFIVLLALAVYWPSMRGEFLWDDDVLLTANEHIQREGGLKSIWMGKETPDYFPLTLTTLWIEWRMFGMETLGYHVVNVLLHAISAVLLWRVLLRLKIAGAFAAAMIFTVHPMCVASVAWIAERKNTLSLIFFLLAALLYLKSEGPAESATVKRKKIPKTYWLSLFVFLLALLSKTSVVVLPLALLGCAWWQRGKIQKQDVLRTAPFFVLSLALGLVTIAFQATSAFSKSDPLLERMLGGGMAVWFYLFKALVPVKLSMVYPRWEIDVTSVVAWLPWLASVGAAILFWRFRQSWGRPLFFAFVYFVVTMLPVLGVFDMSFFAFSRAADHLAYLSLIGIAALLGAALSALWSKSSGQPQRANRFNPVAAAVICLLAVLTWNRAQAFASPEKLWTDTLKKNPKAWAGYNHLGEAMVWKGDIDKAIELFESAVRLNPEYAYAHNNLGNAYMEKRRYDDAMTSFAEALRIWPDYAEAENGWGLALMNKNRVNEAITHFSNALKHAPRYVEGHYNLGIALTRRGEVVRAMEHYRAALKTSPDHVGARLEMAAALSALNKVDDAIAEYREVLRQRPDVAEAYNGLGVVMAGRNKLDDAEQLFRRAVQLVPSDPIVLSNLGDILVKQRKHEEGVIALERALRLAPRNPDISARLAEAKMLAP